MIDPLFFSQKCSDARICLRTGPVCMCGIDKMREEHAALLAVLEAAEDIVDERNQLKLAAAIVAARRLVPKV